MASFGEYTPIDNQNGLLNFQDYGLKAAQTETAQQNLADRATLRAQAEGFASSDPAEVARARGVALSVPVGVASSEGLTGAHADARAQMDHAISVGGGLAQAILLAPAGEREARYQQFLPVMDQLGTKLPRQYPGDAAISGFRDMAFSAEKRLEYLSKVPYYSTSGQPVDPFGVKGSGESVGADGMAGPRSSLNLGQNQIANGKAIYAGLVSRGMDSETALAMAANGLGESGGNWATKPGDGGDSHGIFQWNKDRLAAFQAGNGGKLPGQTSLDAQLDFAMKEWRADHNGAASAAGKLPSAEQKIRPIVSQYEVSANQPADIQKRTAYLNQLRQAGVGDTRQSGVAATPTATPVPVSAVAAPIPAPVQVAGPGAPQGPAPVFGENNTRLPTPPIPPPPETNPPSEPFSDYAWSYRTKADADADVNRVYDGGSAVAAPAPPPIANPNPLLGAGGPAPEPRQNTFMPAAPAAPPAPAGGMPPVLRQGGTGVPMEHPVAGKGYMIGPDGSAVRVPGMAPKLVVTGHRDGSTTVTNEETGALAASHQGPDITTLQDPNVDPASPEYRGAYQREVHRLTTFDAENRPRAPDMSAYRPPGRQNPVAATAPDAGLGAPKTAGQIIPPALQEMDKADIGTIQVASGLKADLGKIREQLASGSLSLGPAQNLISQGRNAIGASNENSQQYATFHATLEKMRNDLLMLAKGVQTEGDARRAMDALLSQTNDPELVKHRLAEVEAVQKRTVDLTVKEMNRRRAQNGLAPVDTAAIEGVQPAIGGKAAPTVGAILKGHRFLGGDPSKPESWQAVQ